MALFQLTLLQAQQQPSMMPTFIMLAAIVVIFYFFMIRPQNKKQKEIQKFRNSLQPGQQVVTVGGLHGTVRSLGSDGTVVLEVATGVKLTFEISAIVPQGQNQQ